MSPRRTKKEATTMAETYGVSIVRAEEALAADAPRPSVAAQEKPADPAESRPEPAAEHRGPRMTSTQLAALHCLSRDQMEAELVRLGLRGPADDGVTSYNVTEVARRFAKEDADLLTRCVELVSNLTSNGGLTARLVGEIVDAETERWIGENDLYGEIADVKKTLLVLFKKTHSYRTVQRSGDAMRELAAIQEFGSSLLDAVSARRQPKAETQGDCDVRV